MADLTFDIFAKENVSGVLDGIADKLKDSEDDWGKWALAAGATGALVGGALIAGVSAALDQQTISTKMAAQLGGTPADAAKYGKLAGDVYAGNYGDSLEGVGDAIVAITQQVGEGSDEWLKKTTQGVLNISSAFDQESGAVSAAIGQLLNNGLVQDSQTALDVITKGFQGGVDKAGDFLDTLNEYAPQWQKFGLDATTATGLLSQGLQAGARDSDLVADSLKEFSIRAIDGSESTKAGFDAIGLSASDMSAKIAAGGPAASDALAQTLDKLRAIEDPAARSAAAVQLFGTQAEDMGAALYALDPTTAVDALGKVKGASDQLDATLGSSGASNLQAFSRQMQQVFVEQVGGRALPVVTDFAQKLNYGLAPALDLAASAVMRTVGFYQQHQVAVNSAAIVVGVLAGVMAIGAVAAGVQSGALLAYLTSTTLVTGATSAYNAVQAGLNIVMSMNPIGLVVIAIAALAAGLIYAYKHSETFRDVVHEGMHKVGDAVDWVKGVFADFVSKGVEGFGKARDAVGWIKDKASEVKGWVVDNWPLLLGILTGPIGLAVVAIAKHWDAIKDGGVKVFDWIKGLPGSIAGSLGDMFAPLWSGFRGVLNKIIGGWNNLKFTIGGGNVFGVDIPSVTVQTPNIPMLATGGTALTAGTALVGERGPEFISMPAGASVVPLPRAAEAVAATMGMRTGGDGAAWDHYAATRREAADNAARLAALERALAALPQAMGASVLDAIRRA